MRIDVRMMQIEHSNEPPTCAWMHWVILFFARQPFFASNTQNESLVRSSIWSVATKKTLDRAGRCIETFRRRRTEWNNMARCRWKLIKLFHCLIFMISRHDSQSVQVRVLLLYFFFALTATLASFIQVVRWNNDRVVSCFFFFVPSVRCLAEYTEYTKCFVSCDAFMVRRFKVVYMNSVEFVY